MQGTSSQKIKYSRNSNLSENILQLMSLFQATNTTSIQIGIEFETSSILHVKLNSNVLFYKKFRIELGVSSKRNQWTLMFLLEFTSIFESFKNISTERGRS